MKLLLFLNRLLLTILAASTPIVIAYWVARARAHHLAFPWLLTAIAVTSLPYLLGKCGPAAIRLSGVTANALGTWMALRAIAADASVNGIWQRLALSMILLFALTIPGAVLLFRPLAAPSRSEPPATSR
jgi:hypothetical protein